MIRKRSGTANQTDLERYFENGQLRQKKAFKDGAPDGPFVVYFMNGQLEVQGSFKDGKQDGLYGHYANG